MYAKLCVNLIPEHLRSAVAPAPIQARVPRCPSCSTPIRVTTLPASTVAHCCGRWLDQAGRPLK